MKQVWGTRSGVKVRNLEDLGDVRPHSSVGKFTCLHLLIASAQVCLLPCLQQDTSSVRLLRRDSGSAKAMMVFSEMHRSHLRDPH